MLVWPPRSHTAFTKEMCEETLSKVVKEFDNTDAHSTLKLQIFVGNSFYIESNSYKQTRGQLYTLRYSINQRRAYLVLLWWLHRTEVCTKLLSSRHLQRSCHYRHESNLSYHRAQELVCAYPCYRTTCQINQTTSYLLSNIIWDEKAIWHTHFLCVYELWQRGRGTQQRWTW
jgi:hypothetical protein